MLTAQSAELLSRPMTPTATRGPSGLTIQLPTRLEDRVERTTLRRLAAKEMLYCAGDARTHVFQIEEGVAMIYRMLPDGRRQVVDFAYPGQFIGLGTSNTHTFNAETVTMTRVRLIPVSALDIAARRDPEIALSLYRAVSLELSSARSLLVAIGQLSALERVATFLVTLCHRLSTEPDKAKDVVIELPMRRAEIADLLGMTIETVSRTLTKLRGMHLIEIINGTTIIVPDLPRLEALAETA